MPTKEDGTWTPRDGWASLRLTFDMTVAIDAKAAADRFITVCSNVGCSPQGVFDQWSYWYGKPKCGKVPNWPAYLTAGEWEQLATYAERDVLKVANKTLTEV